METSVNMTKRTINLAIVGSLIAAAVVLRVLPHPANFAPVAAIAIFGGAVLPKRYAVAAPLLAMMLSDLIIGLHPLIPVTWGCYGLIALASSRWLVKPTFLRGATLTMGSSLFFFVVTNFAVWVYGGLYEHTLARLSRCFVLALPFFRNTALSDLIYTGVLFGVYVLATRLSNRLVTNVEIVR